MTSLYIYHEVEYIMSIFFKYCFFSQFSMKFTFGLCLYSPLHLPFDFSSVHFCTFAPCGTEVPSAACRIPPPVRIPFAELFSDLSHKSQTAGAPRRPRSPTPFSCQSSSRAASTKQHYPALHTQLSAENERAGHKDTKRESK